MWWEGERHLAVNARPRNLQEQCLGERLLQSLGLHNQQWKMDTQTQVMSNISGKGSVVKQDQDFFGYNSLQVSFQGLSV